MQGRCNLARACACLTVLAVKVHGSPTTGSCSTTVLAPCLVAVQDAAERGKVGWPSGTTQGTGSFTTPAALNGQSCASSDTRGAGTGAPRVTATPLDPAATTHTSPPDTDGRQTLPAYGGSIKGVLGYSGPGYTQQTGGELEAEHSAFAGAPSFSSGDE